MTKALLTMAVAALLAVPGSARAQQSTSQQEVRQTIRDAYTYSKDNLADPPDTYSADGALEFWSSGGLMQVVPPDAPRNTYDSFSLTPKHIRVTMLADEQVAVANFYAEGAFKVTGQPAVTDYMTRVTQVFVQENGGWKVRSSHFSPIMGGSGTPQRALEN
jgi:hypothetical protein